MRTLGFDNGDQMPILGLGTWKAEPNDVYAAVKAAIGMGYRHIDCSPLYGNEPEIGQALAECFDEGIVQREDMWITSKLWNDSHAPDDVQPALERTLAALRLDYLDLYLIHWPIAFNKGVAFPESGADYIALDELPISETWEGMEGAHRMGLCRHLGVSNFSLVKTKSLLDTADVKPEVNQIELHPYLQQPELVDFCQSRGVHVTAYSSLGSLDRPDELKGEAEPVLLDDPTVGAIADRLGARPAQVLLAWAIGRNIAVIPKSVNPTRMDQNLAAVDALLSHEDMEAITALDRGRRYVAGDFFTWGGSPYTLANIWDE
jgi:alcohol dehydrogenase (NADP+)